MLDRWSSYTVTIVWEFAWADSELVVFDGWLSYRGGCLNRFDCSDFLQGQAIFYTQSNLEIISKLKCWIFDVILKLYQYYIVSATFLLVCFVCLKGSTLAYFTSKTLFFIEIVRFQLFKYSNVMASSNAYI